MLQIYIYIFFVNRDEATQLVSLKIVQGISAKLKPTEMKEFMPLVTAISSHPSMSCRTVMYDILMWVYDNYRYDTNTALSPSLSPSIDYIATLILK